MNNLNNKPERPTLDFLPFRTGYNFGRAVFTIADVEWNESYKGAGSVSRILRQIPGEDMPYISVEICPSYGTDGPPVRWEWTEMLSRGVYVRHWGSVDSIEEAASSALAYEPERIEIAGNTWVHTILGDYHTWTAAIDGDGAEIVLLSGDTRYRWKRNYEPATNLLALVGGRMEGSGDSLEIAVDAVGDAPARLYVAAVTLLRNTANDAPEVGAFAQGWRIGRAALKTSLLSIPDELPADSPDQPSAQ